MLISSTPGNDAQAPKPGHQLLRLFPVKLGHNGKKQSIGARVLLQVAPLFEVAAHGDVIPFSFKEGAPRGYKGQRTAIRP